MLPNSQQTQNICITFVQRRPNVFGVGVALYKCYINILCLLGYCVCTLINISTICVVGDYNFISSKMFKYFFIFTISAVLAFFVCFVGLLAHIIVVIDRPYTSHVLWTSQQCTDGCRCIGLVGQY